MDETPLHVAEECSSYECLKEAFCRASTLEAKEKWPTCFWCAGTEPRDKEVYDSNMSLSDFSCKESDLLRRTEADVEVEWRRPDHHGRYRMVAGDGACPNQSKKVIAIALPAISSFEPTAHAKAPTAPSSDACSGWHGGHQYQMNTPLTMWQCRPDIAN